MVFMAPAQPVTAFTATGEATAFMAIAAYFLAFLEIAHQARAFAASAHQAPAFMECPLTVMAFTRHQPTAMACMQPGGRTASSLPQTVEPQFPPHLPAATASILRALRTALMPQAGEIG